MSDLRTTKSPRPWRGWSLAFPMVLGILAGCGGVEQEKGLVPVSGRVTLDGGSWPKPGQITFIPTGAGKTPDASSVSYVANFSTDGSFTVAHPGANGMKPGTYAVVVHCTEPTTEMPPPGQAPAEEKGPVPKKYQDAEKSELKLTVEAGKSPTADFDVKSK